MTDRERVNAVLSKLELEKGYFARGPWWCCSNCGWDAIPDGQSDKAVFWNEQNDRIAFDEYDVLRGKLFLQWAGDGAEIVQAFEEAGFQTEWDGTKETTVIVFDEVDPTFHGRW